MKKNKFKLFIIISILIITIVSISIPYINTYATFHDLTYAAIGDSITFGFDVPKFGAQMDEPYPTLIKKKLKLKQVYNYGVSGATLTNHEGFFSLSDYYKEMEDNIDIISVLGGINDYNSNIIPLGTINDQNNNTIYGALNTLTTGLKEKYPNSYIFFMTPYKCGHDKGINALGYSLNDICIAIKEVCNNNNLDVLDLYTYGNIEIDFNNPDSDKLHPTQDFIRKYTAPQISNFIKNNYK